MKEILRQVLDNLDELFEKYDEAGQKILGVAWHDGHFPDRDSLDLVWPPSHTNAGPIDLAGLEERARLITRIFEGVPQRRDHRLGEAYERYTAALPAYHEANRLFVQIKSQFLERQAGSETEFLQLYQSVYLQALGREDPIPLDQGESALVDLGVTRPPLAHASAVVEKLQPELERDDPRWAQVYSAAAGATELKSPLRDVLRLIAERVVDTMAAGEHLAVRYNCFSNFVWFGVSMLKVVTDTDVLVAQLQGRAWKRRLKQLDAYLNLARALLLKFFQAHSEDPAQLRPREFWYGQEYSYLTRDMIDLTRGLIRGANRLRDHTRGVDREVVKPIETPPLLANASGGRFMEYPQVGVRHHLTTWSRGLRLPRWLRMYRQRAQRTLSLHRSDLTPQEKLSAAWDNATNWARGTLDLFEIEVRIQVDPEFAHLAAELDLAGGARKIVFFPTHQGLLDHPVMQHVLNSPELMEAMGWKEPRPCTMLARAGLADLCSIKVGSTRVSLLGMDTETADQLLQEVDGHIVIDRDDDSARPTARFGEALSARPGVVYGAGTTSAFELQVLPMQHALFAYLPQDIVIIPLALRGVHALWPKCPSGNLHLNPGLVEVVISPPMLGETTLLPRKRALRTQLEPATLFQAIHIATLLNPDPTPD